MGNEHHTELIWRIDQPWRDLSDDIAAAGRVTVMTFHSLYLIDVTEGLALRRPGPVAEPGHSDDTPFDFADLTVATPCGLVFDSGSSGSWASVPLAFVATGGRTDTDHIEEFGTWLSAQNPDDVAWTPEHTGDCGARHCPGAALFARSVEGD